MTYFVEDFNTQDKRAALIWAREDYDPGDQWAWSMGWLFNFAGELGRRGEDVPACLEYRAGAGGHHVDEDYAEGLAEIGTDALTYACLVLNRYENACRKAGMSY